MAKIFDLFSLSTDARLNQDRDFYKGFVMGLAFEKIEFANRRAEGYAELLESGHELKEEWIDDFIAWYGDLFDESDEELKEIFQSTDIKASIARLREAEANYSEHFQKQVAGGLTKIEESFDEARQRTKLKIEHTLVQTLRKLIDTNRSKDADLISVLRQIKKPVFSDAYIGFHKKTYGPTEHMVMSAGGREVDAEQVWTNSLLELYRKIKKRPHETGFYKWYDRSDSRPNSAPALMSTFFMKIADFRWKDIRIRPIPNTGGSGAGTDQLASDEYYDEDKVRAAIDQLGEPCASIIWYHHVKKLPLAEVAEKIGKAYGYTRNLHPGCQERLTKLLNDLKID